MRSRADVVLVSVTSPALLLEQVLDDALAARSDGGRLWLCYQKGGPVSRADLGACWSERLHS